ncbi:MAG: tRNA pseudouridine(38-40) synthase TruA [Deltaproteobacteria bacterium]|nr:tRNA pseudouridine(38-40) synthase TruA [Deltaproteobacteria bacterium]
MRNIKLIIEYEGANYAGWQIQKNLPTIQGTIQEKLKIMTGEDIELTASSRTDAGVNALGQTANFNTESRIQPYSFQMGLNALLPDDIVIKNAEDVFLDFDSRKDAKSKTYRYLILNRPYPSAIYRNFSWHVFQKLDIDAMRTAASLLIGKKDFTSFRAAECDALHSVREVLSFSIEKRDDGFLEFEVKGTAFLRHMVRIMVGTLTAIGKGKIKVEEFQTIIDAKDRRLAGITAPPHGLFLKEVEY